MRAALLAAAISVAPSAGPDQAYREALDVLYDGATDTAIEELTVVAQAHPHDPLGAYFQALALCWKIEQRPESSALDRELQRQLDAVLTVAAARLRTDPADARARLAAGGAHGLRSRLQLFRLKSRAAARAAEKMREELLPLHGGETLAADAEFGLGLYDYYVDVLPRMASFFRALSGMPGGDRARGLAAIEHASSHAGFHRVEAAWQLYEIYAYYEDQPDRALEAIRYLRERYPGAPLWALKLAEHERERTGRYREAAAVAREIVSAADRGDANYGPTTGALGRLALGEALLLDLRLPEARRVLLWFRNGFAEAPWLASRARLLLGRTLELEGDRDAALVHYRAAASSPEKEIRKRAEAAVGKAIRDDEVKATVHLTDARRFREAERLRDAAESYRAALVEWPECGEARLRVAEEELRRGRIPAARAQLSELGDEREHRPPWIRPWARLLRAYLYDSVGERTSAVKLYKEVLASPYGDAALVKEAKERLRRPFHAAPPPSAPRPSP